MPVLINFKICDNAEACNGIKVCPTKAFHWNESKKTLEIDKEKCIECGLCATSENTCREGAIHFAKTEEEYKKIKEEIDNDPRTIKDLMVDRYGATPINKPFNCSEKELTKVLTGAKPILVEVYQEDTIECLIKSTPIKEIFNCINDKDLRYRKVENTTEEFLKKYDIKTLPCLLYIVNNELKWKIEGFYSIEEKEKLFDLIKNNILNIKN